MILHEKNGHGMATIKFFPKTHTECDGHIEFTYDGETAPLQKLEGKIMVDMVLGTVSYLSGIAGKCTIVVINENSLTDNDYGDTCGTLTRFFFEIL